MNFLMSAFWMIVVLGILVYIHELGHFLAAKYFGVRVEVFSLGIGPRLFGLKRGDTDYRVSAFPLGGYVRMSGEITEYGDASAVSAPDAPPDPAHYTSKPRWQRLVILLAGPVMNIVLALVLWWGLFMYGSETFDIPQGPPVVERAEAGSPAAVAGLQPGDAIVGIAGRTVASVDDYEESILFKPGQTLTYRVQRAGAVVELPVAVAAHPQFGTGFDGVRIRFPVLLRVVAPGGPAERAGLKAGDQLLEVNGRIPGGLEQVTKLVGASTGTVTIRVLRDGAEREFLVEPRVEGSRRLIGVQLGFPTKFVRYGPVAAAGAAWDMAVQNATLLYRTLSAMVRAEIGINAMSGPIEIARISREQASMGVVPFVMLLAFISLQLGIFNLLPVPVLDGGQIAILLIESARRRDMSLRLKERVLQVGFVMLIVFSVVVIANDVRKAFARRAAAPAAATAPAEAAPKAAPATPAPAEQAPATPAPAR